MTDPLSCLREYTIAKKRIVERNNFIIFGEYCWPKSVKTNYQVFIKQRDATKEYYTLECLFFLLNNLKLNHGEYVNLAKKNGVPSIRRPDRKNLLAYLTGEISTSPSIDTSAPVVYPTKIKLEHQTQITDVVSDSSFQNSPTTSSNEAGTSRNSCQSSLNPYRIPVIVKPEIEEQEEIDIKPNTEELSLLSSSETNFSRNKKQFPSVERVKQVEDFGNLNKKQRMEALSLLSATETTFSRIAKQFPSVERMKQVKDLGKINKKQRIENSPTTSSSEAGTSRNSCQSSLIVIPVRVKPEVEEQEEIDIKPNAEELSLLSSTETNISRNDKQFSSVQRVKQVEDFGKINKKQRIEYCSTLSSSDGSISRNGGQRYFNHDQISSTVKQETEEQDEIDIKPSIEEEDDCGKINKKQRTMFGFFLS